MAIPRIGRNFEPTVVAISHLPNQRTAELLARTIRYDLGPGVADAVSRSIEKQSFSPPDLSKDEGDLGQSWIGIFLPNIIERIRLRVSYGTIEILCMEDLIRQERERANAVKIMPLPKGKDRQSRLIRAMSRATGNKSMQVVRLIDALSNDDLKNAKAILGHFQEKENERVAKIPSIPFVAKAV
jgi:hypothetical protein